MNKYKFNQVEFNFQDPYPQFTYVGSGGITVGGPNSYTLDVEYEATSGGVTIGGEAETEFFVSNYTYEMSGGITISGPANNIRDYDYCMANSSPILIGGSAVVAVRPNYGYVGSGGVNLGGGLSGTVANFVYVGSGGILLGGGSIQENEISIDISIGWNTLAEITIEIPMGWNTGDTPLFWYRVEGVCQPLTCPPISDADPANKNCNYSFITNIVASDPCEVCTQLANNRFLRNIKSIKKFSTPARESDIAEQEALGLLASDCNTLTAVDFCQCLPCKQFCDYEEFVFNEGGLDSITKTFHNPGMTHVYNARYQKIASYPSADGNCYILVQSGEDLNSGTYEQYQYPCGSTTTTTTALPSYEIVVSGKVRIRGSAVVSWKPNVVDLTASTNLVTTSCGCVVPSQVFFTHDLSKANKFKDFLRRNNLTIPNVVVLSYSVGGQSWINNHTYTGIGLDGASNERWTVISTLECTNNLDGFVASDNPHHWKLSIYVRQQNLTKNSSLDTRLQLIFSDTGPCQKGELNVRAYLNVRTLLVSPLDPPNISLGASVQDRIGLFQGDFWVRNPKFLFDVDVHNRDLVAQRILFGPLLPQNEVSRLN